MFTYTVAWAKVGSCIDCLLPLNDEGILFFCCMGNMKEIRVLHFSSVCVLLICGNKPQTKAINNRDLTGWIYV
jgi:hypothetical protein